MGVRAAEEGGGCIYCSYSTCHVQVSSVWDVGEQVAHPTLPVAQAAAQAGRGRGVLLPLYPGAYTKAAVVIRGAAAQ